ncbi:unnamed protein product [Acanthoscelides obtectus]|uniref:Uncharacterized protein n=1 Tax=Acanthoscelides obtectus TaxID=200917 RepID=A0A9P0JMM6_ACAOB|nr:unnamed protein product [Acanthoscelides obtectus]CAK1672997.1 hypothetical protein AOBTE_LOCUS29183 [Acanthoscelides obtectus]
MYHFRKGFLAVQIYLSPIETLWHEMKKVLRQHPARTITELRQKLQEI